MALDPVTSKLLISAGVSVLGSLFGRKKRRRELKRANAERKEMKAAYMDLDFSNPYENLSNPYEGMENPMEDLTVNQQQAKFQAQQGTQRRADILGGLRQAAGGSGVAGLAQSLANQQQKQTQQISASIGQQEATNQRASVKGQMQIDQLERSQEAQNQFYEARGARETQALEQGRTETIYGMSLQRSAAAKQASNQATKNLIGGVGGALAGYAGTGVGSYNINTIFGGGKFSWQDGNTYNSKK